MDKGLLIGLCFTGLVVISAVIAICRSFPGGDWYFHTFDDKEKK